ncbi:MAG: class I SAM-dependent methyltransferase [Anaerolineaceae bacterium]
MRLIQWHNRYILQAFWTHKLRQFLLSKIQAHSGDKVLDVGSGTGALFSDFHNQGIQVTGLDNDFDRCQFSFPLNNSQNIICGNGYALPVASGSYDLAVCHYLLLWLKTPELLLREMKRVIKPGGYLIAFAEPDYQSRIDYPELFQKIGQFQNHSLAFQGVDLAMGRKLGSLFRGLGLENVNVGLLAGEWKDPTLDVFLNEWDMIAYDLGGFVPADEILELKSEAQAAWLDGTATIFIPTFYAYGQVPCQYY